ncbi:hypothetical protein O6H91_14G050000 [Diphasiastrum complanatum]|uniref:Uncharacterized protein n=12 Tax=Diphasiastrum complanatum TaxID=34168 RepID=A0ACC2BP88_DIPCM|nr:hypothetical protein O6H91_14G050000 [Diphasiastrum complanatum]KAJ7531588.1 hypothetical protein O6H91_14G050000 [Diphasiastrum complanatum]KAJ7531589.1 hypothetical protein O6H91_14G050000 [Diphasiastrum complanatum]KAJ7531590.1 hypothetical protein O6H91_14G050000 [Diphasiastrum complanatum]KAJ7531591.1 hypothetical protein O6H91_14G050000 [Diphasiastrum complanatum]
MSKPGSGRPDGSPGSFQPSQTLPGTYPFSAQPPPGIPATGFRPPIFSPSSPGAVRPIPQAGIIPQKLNQPFVPFMPQPVTPQVAGPPSGPPPLQMNMPNNPSFQGSPSLVPAGQGVQVRASQYPGPALGVGFPGQVPQYPVPAPRPGFQRPGEVFSGPLPPLSMPPSAFGVPRQLQPPPYGVPSSNPGGLSTQLQPSAPYGVPRPEQAAYYGGSNQGYYGGVQYPSTASSPTAHGGYPTPPGGLPAMGGYGASLVEDFESLSLLSVPGSIDSRVDLASLPRPLDDLDLSKKTWVTNCHPRYFHLTCNAIPNAHSLAARWHLPLGAIVHPLAEAPEGEEVPVVNFGTTGIVRCRRCRTYINPYAMFTDGGRHWRCNVCSLLNEVPMDYYCPLDADGKRRDVNERPELSQGSVEFVAPTEYMVRPPMPPVYFFLIDVSHSAVRSGMLQIAMDSIKSCLDRLPGSSRTQIGFLAFDSNLYFYSLKSSLRQPQMIVMPQSDEVFLPMPDDLLVNLSDSRAVVEALLDNLPSIFADNMNVESALGPALQATTMIMSQLGGKLLIFQSTLPSLGVGRLKLRGDDPRIYGTEKENTIRITEDSVYKQMAAEFSKFQIAVNIYAFSEKYTDLASLGTLSKYTGGQVYYYPGFQPNIHGQKFSYELARDLTRETAWESVMRIRCGKGIRFSTFHGHFMLRSSDLLALPAVDCDKTYAVQISLEDTLLTSQIVYFQVALLFTSSSGERRIRVHTAAAPVVSDLSEMYKVADTGAIVSVLSRLGIEASLTSKLEDARQNIQVKVVRSLREFRNLHAVKHQLTGRLVYPESLKFLPIYTLALWKSLALRGGFMEAQPDERSAAAFEMMIMSRSRLLKFLYPSLIRIDEFLSQGKSGASFLSGEKPSLPLSSEKLDPRGAFLFYDGFRFILWLGRVLPVDFVVQLLGKEAAENSDLSKVAVSEQNNDLSKRFHGFLTQLKGSNHAVYPPIILVRQGDQPREGILLLANLVEDRNVGLPGYAEWMIQLYKQVQQKM